MQGHQIVGREPELAALSEFLEAGEARALVLTGGPGIGKTTLWSAAIAATDRRVLRAQPAATEAQLAFATLIDLCDGVDTYLAGIPVPQRAALDAALLRAPPTGTPPESGAIGLGFLNLLRGLAAAEPLLVAIDDVQWLDPPSADAIAFAARRLAGDRVVLLLARRPGRVSPVERAFARGALQRFEVGPLSPDATRRLVAERLDLTLSRDVLRRVVEPALGNPLFALELGRELLERGPGEEIPLPDALEELLGTRVDRLPPPLHTALLAVALSGDLQVAELARVAPATALDDAVDAGLLVVESGHVRAAHPLLAALARKRSRTRERRELHRAVAAAIEDGELRALHLALATDHHDAWLATAVADAVDTALARGARDEAVGLAEHAVRLTPPEAPEHADRVLTLGQCLDAAGEPQRVTDLLTPALASLPAGAAQVRAQLLLAEGGGVRCMADHVRHLDLALQAADGDPVLRAHVLAKQAANTAATCVERLVDAEAWAREALAQAPRAGVDVERLALFALSWARALRGRSLDDLCERFDAASEAVAQIAYAPQSVVGQRLKWRGEVAAARDHATALLRVADERGEAVSYALERLFLCELELRAGAWADAERLLDEWSRSPDPLVPFTHMRCRAQLAAGRGLPDEAERWAAPAIAGAQEIGTPWQQFEGLHARGTAALLAHDPARAVDSLRPVWEHAEREGVEPGAFPVAPDLVEALVEAGDHDGAWAVTTRLGELADELDHPWARVTARRCSGIVRLASSAYDEEAAATLATAAAEYGRMDLRFDVPRSHLALGRAQRRLRKWGAARDSLEQAVAGFDALGSPGWADEARTELARVGARRPRPSGELTPSEQRVVELAAEGRSNKEIAQTLFVTIHTVEVHLSRAYAKLGVRSRGQLAGRLAVKD